MGLPIGSPIYFKPLPTRPVFRKGRANLHTVYNLSVAFILKMCIIRWLTGG